MVANLEEPLYLPPKSGIRVANSGAVLHLPHDLDWPSQDQADGGHIGCPSQARLSQWLPQEKWTANQKNFPICGPTRVAIQ